MFKRPLQYLAGLALFVPLLSLAGAARADEEASKKIYPQTLRGTVWVRCIAGREEWSGSGWVVDRERKMIVTNHHVVDGADRVFVYFPVYQDDQVIPDRNYYLEKADRYLGRVLDSESKRDLAVIELDMLPRGVSELKLAAKSPMTASTVHTVGNPGGPVAEGMTPDPLWKYTRGEVSSVYRRKFVLSQHGQAIDATVVQTTQPINPGDSGGPVVNDRGEVVAVTTAFREGGNLLSYAIDVTEVKAFLEEAFKYYHPDSALAFRKRGQHYYDNKRFSAAAADFTSALRLEKDAATYRSRGDAYRNGSAYEQAIADYVQVLRLNPKDGPAQRERGVCYFALEQYEQAIEDLSRAVQIAADDLRARYFRGMSWREAGEPERALKEFDDLLRVGPASDRVDYFFQRGLTYLGQSNWDKAIADLEKAGELEPQWANPKYQLGEAYARKGDTEKAISSYSAALKVNPRSLLAYVKRGDAFNKTGKYKEAIADFDAALQLDSRFAPGYAGRGLANSRLQDFDKAIDDLTQALWLNPKDAGSYVERAFAYWKKHNLDLAIEDATEVIRLNPTDVIVLAGAFNVRGLSYDDKDLLDKAIADYSKALSYNPKSAVFYTNRAICEYRSSTYDRAVADCTRAIECEPKYAAAYLWRSRAFEKLGKAKEAKQDFEKAMEYNPKLKTVAAN
jgi:tetratricopeptide (TPR) repeat protein